ncbi:2OG-Fe(II) oxygenase [Reyranella sp. CPCC 100927]|uniref:2OG-Fe(II) oxygenase n=1 Tax=Reyranella sp. CPCC 100927 TaxID=2599616 RepID=UPI0011B7E4B3|nr:2OG-Fe(II) oxygenase [Reyranella sp. CPCC 100927]TWT11644.1 2OG-Fe(II) oxygenase [Reyranella sp. CPCC 100927]
MTNNFVLGQAGADAGHRHARAYVSLDGVELDTAALVNPAMLMDDSIEALGERFRQAQPFKHLVFEGLFEPRLLERIHDEFEFVSRADWERYDNRNERKLGTKPSARLGPAAQLYFDTIYSKRFVDFLGRISGIDGLITDPMLYGGGLHKIPTGGKFAPHVDFNKHPVTRLDNRLVFLTYLNKDWKPEYGGALQLWDVDSDRCTVEVVPEFGRSILFYQSSRSIHGHPDPVRAPNGRARRSAAAYFYSNGRGDESTDHYHTTIIRKPITVGPYARLALGVKYWTPPVLIDAFRLITRRQWP